MHYICRDLADVQVSLFFGGGMAMEVDVNAIRSITTYWNQTEAIIKEAENIQYAMVVPAIKELRYAGRKLIDYLISLESGEEDKIRENLEEFHQCCIRARHDAVDTTLNYIDEYFQKLEERIDPILIQEKFPEYTSTRKLIIETSRTISESRSDRTSRIDKYSEIIENTLFDIIGAYNKLRGTENLVFLSKNILDKQQKAAFYLSAAGLSAIIAAILGFLTFLLKAS